MASALNNLVKSNKKPDMIIFRGDEPINEYNNPDLMMGMFPTLFPLGIGGFEDPERPTYLSFHSQCNYYLDTVCRDFRHHNAFIFVAMNMIQHRQAHLFTHFAVKSDRFDHVADDITSIKPDTIRAVANHLEHEGHMQDLSSEHQKVFTLLDQVKAIAGKITGSEASKVLYRNEMRAYTGHFGLFHLFFTANPAPAHSPIFQFMWGDKTVNLDERYPQIAEYAQRGLRLAQDLVAGMDFFDFVVRCLFQYMFGWDFDMRMSTEAGGILGHLEVFYGTDELTGRGAYHGHFLLILKGCMNPTELHRKLEESRDFQDRFFAFLDDIIVHDLPDGIPFDHDGNPRTERPPVVPSEDATAEEWDIF
ncbi:uncharacterized protein EV420DRAFT_1278633 [Desarmillaria tabescens]|uniref:Helitron helicase-like domain-containing protein n=1 Tax=Armillaria tabescens TaxID=1929756 RepID=A0AA39JGH9_ARMTA|nr:uncharacterized protein EV420DRAFT_1278633 [Desarmillaria tabescens]KAK0441510.1 hypothetical protein EV420DRAFT_1278633 [Desarmillaria tabescens]